MAPNIGHDWAWQPIACALPRVLRRGIRNGKNKRALPGRARDGIPEDRRLPAPFWLIGLVRPQLTRVRAVPGGGDFWRLWVVGLVLFVVRWIETIAVAVFVYQRTGSALIVAGMTMLRILPMGLLGTFLGALADRLERRTGLILIVLVSLATTAVLALLAHFDRLAVWHLAVASLINGTGWAADNPVRRMMIGDVVGVQRMSTAISIDVGSNNASRMAGPTIGGFLLATAGIAGAFSLDAALYVIALVAAVGIRYRNNPEHRSSGQMLTRIAEGLNLARSNSRLRAILLITIIFNVFGWPFTSMIPVIGQDNLHLGPEGIGMLASVEGIGAFAGAIAVALYARPTQHAALYTGGLIAYLLMLTLFALAPDVVLAGLALLATGLTGAGYSIMQTTLMYRSAPPEMRGRMLGVLATCIGTGPIGFIHLGLSADAIGAGWATAALGIEGLLVLALTWPLWRVLTEKEDV
jgi:MFS family permease